MNPIAVVLEAFAAGAAFGLGRTLGAWAGERYREHAEDGRPLWPLNAKHPDDEPRGATSGPPCEQFLPGAGPDRCARCLHTYRAHPGTSVHDR